MRPKSNPEPHVVDLIRRVNHSVSCRDVDSLATSAMCAFSQKGHQWHAEASVFVVCVTEASVVK